MSFNHQWEFRKAKGVLIPYVFPNQIGTGPIKDIRRSRFTALKKAGLQRRLFTISEGLLSGIWFAPVYLKGSPNKTDNPLILCGAGGRNRTDMPLRAEDFESSASTSFTTPACGWHICNFRSLVNKIKATIRIAALPGFCERADNNISQSFPAASSKPVAIPIERTRFETSLRLLAFIHVHRY